LRNFKTRDPFNSARDNLRSLELCFAAVASAELSGSCGRQTAEIHALASVATPSFAAGGALLPR
jgi:hypothetical protein